MENNALINQEQSIHDLMNKITGDGRIDKQDVNELKKFLMDDNGHYAMDQKKADMLVLLKKWPSSKDKVDDSFKELFIDAICKFLLGDDDSSGRLDDKEIDFLERLIKDESGIISVDDIDLDLLVKLDKKSTNFPPDFKQIIIRQNLLTIRRTVVEKKEITDKDVNKIKEIICKKDDSVHIERNIIEILYQIKDALSGRGNGGKDNASFREVFLDSISAFLLNDQGSPDMIDEEETKWLIEMILKKRDVDIFDKFLLEKLRNKSIYFPDILTRIDLYYTVKKNKKITKENVDKLKEVLPSLNRLGTRATKEDAEYLFQLKDEVPVCDKNENKDIDDEFTDVYIQTISSFLLEDSDSPGRIDNKEAEWLIARIYWKNGYPDLFDRKLSKSLENKATDFPSILKIKQPWLRKAEEKILFKSSYLALGATFSSIVASAFIFVRGILKTCWVLSGKRWLRIFFDTSSSTEPEVGIDDHTIETIVNQIVDKKETADTIADDLIVNMVETIDTFLVAIMLFIFGIGVYEIFVNKIKPRLNTEERPKWARISSIDDLKSLIVKVVIIALIVNFYKHVLRIQINDTRDVMYVAIGILLISLAFVLVEITRYFHKDNTPHASPKSTSRNMSKTSEDQCDDTGIGPKSTSI